MYRGQQVQIQGLLHSDTGRAAKSCQLIVILLSHTALTGLVEWADTGATTALPPCSLRNLWVSLRFLDPRNQGLLLLHAGAPLQA